MDVNLQYYKGAGDLNYGRKAGVILSLLFHAVAIGGVIWASVANRPDRPPPNAMTVKLGGPPKMELSGEARKAPVAGVSRKKPTPAPKAKPKPVKKAPPKRATPKKNEIGLNRDKKKPEKKPAPTPAPEETPSRSTDPTPPKAEPEPEDKAAIARGGFGDNGAGITMQVGDGSENVEKDDLEFINYYKTVLAEVSKQWVKTGLEGGTARIRFYIDREGRVSNMEVVQSAGRSFLDGPAKRAILASEFPPLPHGYRGDKLIFNINFQYGAQK